GRTKFSRYPKIIGITGQNFSIKYEALKKIDKFSQDKTIATDISMGYDIKNKGFKLYQLKDYPHRIFVDYSNSLREYFKQKTIWVENYLLYSYFFAKKGLIKFILLFILSTFIILTPFLFIINMGIQIIGFLIFINIYLIKIRKLLFFKSTVDKKYYDKFKLRFYISLFFLIYFEALINLTIPFHFVYFIIKLKKKRIKT
ncbi:MAG: glycosyltransferase, partial [Promethearchaeota archaeon]